MASEEIEGDSWSVPESEGEWEVRGGEVEDEAVLPPLLEFKEGRNFLYVTFNGFPCNM